MLKEAIEKILSLSEKDLIESDGRTYTPKALKPIKEPLAETLKVGTLSSFVDYIKLNRDELVLESTLVHIGNPGIVHLISEVSSDWKERDCYIEANRDNYPSVFQFGQYMDVEEFIVQLQSRIVPDTVTAQLLRIAGNMRSEKVQTASDDGITQIVSAKAGVMLAEQIALPNPVHLAPFRTFVEIDQPVSAFIFRVKQGRDGEMPRCALFEADGGAWKLEAVKRIKEYLVEHLPKEIGIIA